MSTLTDACEQLKVYIIFFFRLQWYFYVPTVEQAAPEAQGEAGARSQPTSCHRSEAIGEKPCAPPWGRPRPPARPHLCERWAGSTPRLRGRQGREECKNPPPARATSASHQPIWRLVCSYPRPGFSERAGTPQGLIFQRY